MAMAMGGIGRAWGLGVIARSDFLYGGFCMVGFGDWGWWIYWIFEGFSKDF